MLSASREAIRTLLAEDATVAPAEALEGVSRATPSVDLRSVCVSCFLVLVLLPTAEAPAFELHCTAQDVPGAANTRNLAVFCCSIAPLTINVAC